MFDKVSPDKLVAALAPVLLLVEGHEQDCVPIQTESGMDRIHRLSYLITGRISS